MTWTAFTTRRPDAGFLATYNCGPGMRPLTAGTPETVDELMAAGFTHWMTFSGGVESRHADEPIVHYRVSDGVRL